MTTTLGLSSVNTDVPGHLPLDGLDTSIVSRETIRQLSTTGLSMRFANVIQILNIMACRWFFLVSSSFLALAAPSLICNCPAPWYGPLVGPITGMLDPADFPTITNHDLSHPCFPDRLCAGLFHCAPNA
jgi:hypothetical protein